MVKTRHRHERAIRRAAVIVCLRRFGPATTASLARRLAIKPAALNQWMVVNAIRFNDWVRMPNRCWLLLDEEPIERTFDEAGPLP